MNDDQSIKMMVPASHAAHGGQLVLVSCAGGDLSRHFFHRVMDAVPARQRGFDFVYGDNRGDVVDQAMTMLGRNRTVFCATPGASRDVMFLTGAYNRVIGQQTTLWDRKVLTMVDVARRNESHDVVHIPLAVDGSLARHQRLILSPEMSEQDICRRLGTQMRSDAVNRLAPR